jgi:hypothetical protein
LEPNGIGKTFADPRLEDPATSASSWQNPPTRILVGAWTTRRGRLTRTEQGAVGLLRALGHMDDWLRELRGK